MLLINTYNILLRSQSSSSWTPDPDRMNEAKLARLCEAHGSADPTVPDHERCIHDALLRHALENGALLISFTNENL